MLPLLAWRAVSDEASTIQHAAQDSTFGFDVRERRGAARLGVLRTPHGSVSTPAFVAVGTQATVKSVAPETVAATGDGPVDATFKAIEAVLASGITLQLYSVSNITGGTR